MPNVVIFFANTLSRKIEVDRFKLLANQELEPLPEFIYNSLKTQDGVAFSRSFVERKLAHIVEALVVHQARVPRVRIFARLCGLLPPEDPVYHPELVDITLQLLSWICQEKTCTVAALLLFNKGSTVDKTLTHKSAWRVLSRLFYESPASRAWCLAKYRTQCAEFGIEMPWPEDTKRKLEQQLVNSCRVSQARMRSISTASDIDEVTVSGIDRAGEASNRTVDLADYGLSTEALLQLVISSWLEEELRVRTALNAIIYQKETRARRRYERQCELRERGMQPEELTDDERGTLLALWKAQDRCTIADMKYGDLAEDGDDWSHLTGPLRWEAGMTGAQYREYAVKLRRLDEMEKKRKLLLARKLRHPMPQLSERLLDLPRSNLDRLAAAVVAEYQVVAWEDWEWETDWDFGGLRLDPRAAVHQAWSAYQKPASEESCGGDEYGDEQDSVPETTSGSSHEEEGREEGEGEEDEQTEDDEPPVPNAPSFSPGRRPAELRAASHASPQDPSETLAAGPTSRSATLDLSSGRAAVDDEPTPLLKMLAGPAKGVTKLSLASNRLGPVAADVFAALSEERNRGTPDAATRASSTASDANLPLTLARSVTSLNMSDNQIGSKSTPALGSLLRSTLSLRRLDLSWNQLNEADVSVLSQGLADNTTLEFLGLSMNSLGSVGVDHVANALRNHPTLTCLDVSFNRAGEHCCLQSLPRPKPVPPPTPPSAEGKGRKGGGGGKGPEAGGRGGAVAAAASAAQSNSPGPVVYQPPSLKPGSLVHLLHASPTLTCLDLRGNLLGQRAVSKLQETAAVVLAETGRSVELLVDPQPEKAAGLSLEDFLRSFRAKHGLPLDPPPPAARKVGGGGKKKGKKGKGGKKKKKGKGK